MTDAKLLVTLQYLKPLNYVQTNELRLISKCFQQNVFTKYIQYICLKRIWH